MANKKKVELKKRFSCCFGDKNGQNCQFQIVDLQNKFCAARKACR